MKLAIACSQKLECLVLHRSAGPRGSGRGLRAALAGSEQARREPSGRRIICVLSTSTRASCRTALLDHVGVVEVSGPLPQGMSLWARVHSRSAAPGRSWGRTGCPDKCRERVGRLGVRGMVGRNTPGQVRVACSSWGRVGWLASRRTAAARAMLDLVGLVVSSWGRAAWQSPQWSAANSGTPAAADSWHSCSGELVALGHLYP